MLKSHSQINRMFIFYMSMMNFTTQVPNLNCSHLKRYLIKWTENSPLWYNEKLMLWRTVKSTSVSLLAPQDLPGIGWLYNCLCSSDILRNHWMTWSFGCALFKPSSACRLGEQSYTQRKHTEHILLHSAQKSSCTEMSHS